MQKQILTSLKQIKPQFTENELGINPFVQDLKIKIGYKKSTKKVVDISNIKLEEEIVTIGETETQENVYIIEKEEKASIYTKSGLRLHVNELSPKAKSLFLWLMYEIDYGKDYIWINVQRYLIETNTSVNTYKNAIVELNRQGVLSPIMGLNNMFWINPIFFFKGNRVKKYSNNVNIV